MMAHIAVRWTDELDAGFVLAPERYDPRISQQRYLGDADHGQTLGQLFEISREVLLPSNAGLEHRYMVLDTGDAKNGIISRKALVDHRGIGSAKKVLRPGDVIVSRLRPYLRQVGFVDRELTACSVVVASTEFYVLRSRDGSSAAYLVPFLLSDRIQQIFSASQEGGHHPRVPEKTLMDLVLPQSFMKLSSELSQRIEKATEAARESEQALSEALNEVSGLIP